ncbi:MAG: ABC transporter permease subunit [Candidatus Hydrogenedentota bacterium]
MIGRILNAYSIEISKVIRLRSTFLGPLLIIIIVLLAPFGYPIQQDNDSDYDFLAYVLPLAINVFGHFMVLIYSATLISTELSNGSIRMMLTRPLRRREYLMAKLLHGISYALVLNVIAVATAFVVVRVLGNLSGIYFGDDLIYTDKEMLTTLAYTIALTALPQFASVSFALLLSTATRNSAASVGGALAVWIGLETLKHPLGIQRYLFSTYAENPWAVFSDRCNAFPASFVPDAYWGIAVPVLYIVIFSGLTLYIIGRRNLVA